VDDDSHARRCRSWWPSSAAEASGRIAAPFERATSPATDRVARLPVSRSERCRAASVHRRWRPPRRLLPTGAARRQRSRAAAASALAARGEHLTQITTSTRPPSTARLRPATVTLAWVDARAAPASARPGRCVLVDLRIRCVLASHDRRARAWDESRERQVLAVPRRDRSRGCGREHGRRMLTVGSRRTMRDPRAVADMAPCR